MIPLWLFATSYSCGVLIATVLVPNWRAGVVWFAGLMLVAAIGGRFCANVWLLRALIIGLGLTLLQLYAREPPVYPQRLQGVVVTVTGSVTGLVDQTGNVQTFDFNITQGQINGRQVVSDSRVRLTWVDAPERVQPTQNWSFDVRLRSPRGRSNPGGFDVEHWAWRKGLSARGYVVNRFPAEQLAGPRRLAADWWRSQFNQWLDALTLPATVSPLIKALVTGDRSALTKQHWHVLRATGTAHLMAISGLHIGLAAGLGVVGVRAVGRIWPAKRQTRHWHRIAIVAGLVPAIIYALASGFAVPAQRALIMLCCICVCVMTGRAVRIISLLSLAFAAVVTIDPLSVFDTGMWLSFIAVAAIAWHLGQAPVRIVPALHTRVWRRLMQAVALLRLQFALWLLLLPLVVMVAAQISVLSPLANVIAVPVVSLLIVPLCLCAALAWLLQCSAIATGLIQLASLILAPLWEILERFTELNVVMDVRAIPSGVLLLAAVGAWLLYLPRAVVPRTVLLVLLTQVLFWNRQDDIQGLRLTLLDVGQGLAVVVQQKRHTLLFDTGRSYHDGGSVADHVITPFFRHQGIKSLDWLIVSHEDDDHAGGIDAVISAVPVQQKLVSRSLNTPAQPHLKDAITCRAGQSWPLGDATMHVVWPVANIQMHGNDASCVLLIDSAFGRVLIASDIESAAEAALTTRLLRESANLLPIDVLVIPHHGSDTSSTIPFVHAVNPLVGLFSTASGNRYGHPHKRVVTRYRDRGVGLYDTASGGAISVWLTSTGLWVKEHRHSRQVKYPAHPRRSPG